MNGRKYYLDHIRFATVLLVLIYHVFYLYNAAGVPGGAGSFSKVQYQDALLYFVYPWFMVLLFVVAGISARHSLQKRTHREFLKAETGKLLVPSTLGLFLYHWITGAGNLEMAGSWQYLDMLPAFAKYLICVISGIGPLWFIQMLWLFSVLLIFIRKIDRTQKLYRLCEKMNFGMVLSLGLLLWGAAQIGNLPVITTYRFGIYFTAYLLGYFVLSQGKHQKTLEKRYPFLLGAAVLLGVCYTVKYFGENYTSDTCLRSFFTAVYLWIVILAILGTAGRWWNHALKWTACMSRVGFGIYVVHYPIAVWSCYLLKTYTALPVLFRYLIPVITVPVLSLVLFEILGRIPLVRYLLFGIKNPVTG